MPDSDGEGEDGGPVDGLGDTMNAMLNEPAESIADPEADPDDVADRCMHQLARLLHESPTVLPSLGKRATTRVLFLRRVAALAWGSAGGALTALECIIEARKQWPTLRLTVGQDLVFDDPPSVPSVYRHIFRCVAEKSLAEVPSRNSFAATERERRTSPLHRSGTLRVALKELGLLATRVPVRR